MHERTVRFLDAIASRSRTSEAEAHVLLGHVLHALQADTKTTATTFSDLSDRAGWEMSFQTLYVDVLCRLEVSTISCSYVSYL